MQKIFLFILFLVSPWSLGSTDRSCSQSALKGIWVDLTTLNEFEVQPDCSFHMQIAKCKLDGIYVSNDLGQFLNFKNHSKQTYCPMLGERPCEISRSGDLLSLQCLPDNRISFVRADSRSLTLLNLSVHEQTLNLMRDSNPKKLELHLKTLAEKGRPEAAAALAYQYFYGLRGLNTNYAEALKLNEQAASSYLTAQTLLGMQYLYGLGTKYSFDKAERAFLKSAESDDVTAQKALAGMYLSHKNSPLFQQKAIDLLQRASALGDVQAREHLQAIRGPVEEIKPRKLNLKFEKNS